MKKEYTQVVPDAQIADWQWRLMEAYGKDVTVDDGNGRQWTFKSRPRSAISIPTSFTLPAGIKRPVQSKPVLAMALGLLQKVPMETKMAALMETKNPGNCKVLVQADGGTAVWRVYSDDDDDEHDEDYDTFRSTQVLRSGRHEFEVDVASGISNCIGVATPEADLKADPNADPPHHALVLLRTGVRYGSLSTKHPEWKTLGDMGGKTLVVVVDMSRRVLLLGEKGGPLPQVAFAGLPEAVHLAYTSSWSGGNSRVVVRQTSAAAGSVGVEDGSAAASSGGSEVRRAVGWGG